MNVKKIIEKMERQPNGIRPDEAKKVLEYYGFECVRQKGSHAQFLNRRVNNGKNRKSVEKGVHCRYFEQNRDINFKIH